MSLKMNNVDMVRAVMAVHRQVVVLFCVSVWFVMSFSTQFVLFVSFFWLTTTNK